MDTSKYITQIKGTNGATVRILRVSPDEVLTCYRDCGSLEESEDGSIQCSLGLVKKMANFQSTALVIDYEVIMDRKADWQWLVCGADFDLIDENGEIHEGNTICRSMKSPKGLTESLKFVYPGSRAKFRVFYESFPKGVAIASFICNQLGENCRIDFISEKLQDNELETVQSIEETPQEPDDLRERVEMLEKQMRRLRGDFDSLRLTLASKGVISYRHKDTVMTDSGIEYHPMDEK